MVWPEPVPPVERMAGVGPPDELPDPPEEPEPLPDTMADVPGPPEGSARSSKVSRHSGPLAGREVRVGALRFPVSECNQRASNMFRSLRAE